MILESTPHIVVQLDAENLNDAQIENLGNLIEPELEKLYIMFEQVRENIVKILAAQPEVSEFRVRVIQ